MLFLPLCAAAQILAVGITHRKTLEGLIDQIFDKALTETGFCEMWVWGCGDGLLRDVGGQRSQGQKPSKDENLNSWP